VQRLRQGIRQPAHGVFEPAVTGSGGDHSGEQRHRADERLGRRDTEARVRRGSGRQRSARPASGEVSSLVSATVRMPARFGLLLAGQDVGTSSRLRNGDENAVAQRKMGAKDRDDGGAERAAGQAENDLRQILEIAAA
jgi:hypothetical protein